MKSLICLGVQAILDFQMHGPSQPRQPEKDMASLQIAFK